MTDTTPAIPLATLLAAMDDLDSRRLSDVVPNELAPVTASALADKLTQMYAQQGVTVSRTLVEQVALRHSQPSTVPANFFNADGWQKLGPSLAAAAILQDPSFFNSDDSVDTSRVLWMFGLKVVPVNYGRAQKLEALTGEKQGIALIEWVPFQNEAEATTGRFLIDPQMLNPAAMNYLKMLGLWRLLHTGWNAPFTLYAARHLPGLNTHLAGMVDADAEAFAMEMLLPETSVRTRAKATSGWLWKRKRPASVEALSNLFDAPEDMVVLRLKQLGLVETP